MKPLIKNLSLDEAEVLFASLGEKPYRARQLFVWLYEKNIETFEAMTTFTKELRAHLAAGYDLSALRLAERQVSALDGTEKYLLETRDGHFIESVLIKNDGNDDGRLTVCISSQVGCAMGCRFCETGTLGFIRNLEPGEILDQLSIVRRASGVRNNNIVFMGMGEPFLNYDNVMKAAAIMNYTFGFHLSVRKITISTSGILSAIERFIDEEQPYNLAISLNDTIPERRLTVMPAERSNPMQSIRSLLEKKFPVSHNRLTIEYVMRRDNIAPEDARRLKGMFRYNRVKLNLIPLNRGSHGMEPPDDEAINRFVKELEIMNIPITIRKSLGSDIAGACGQLSGSRTAAQGRERGGTDTAHANHT